MIKPTILGVCVLAVTLSAYGQEAVSGTTADGRQVRAEFVAPNIVKVTNIGSNETPAGVQSVLETPLNTGVASGNIEVTIDGSGVLTIRDNITGVEFTDPGTRFRAGEETRIDLINNTRGSVYGGGERGHKLNMRGDTLVNYNRQNYGYTGSDPRISQMNITMPIVIGGEGYALIFDDFAASRTILGDTISYLSESPVPVSYYYIGGTRDFGTLTESMTSLTGRQPLPPLWSLGYITSKYGYKTAAEAEAVVDTFKMRGYPLDGMVLDLYWFGQEQDMGRLDWETSTWPDPAGLMNRLKERNVNMITVSEPYVLRNGLGIENYNMLAQDSMFVRDADGNPHEVVIWVGEGGMFDVSNPKTRQWLTDRYKMLTDIGVEGWWGDLGEPEVHPETGIHANGLTARQYHNHYGNDWSSIISDLYAKEYPDKRLMTLMRGGSTGLQRHSVFPWSTDVSRSWGGLEPQVRIMLNSGLSGMGYMSSDLGGFAVDPENAYIPELYVRWVQMGLFTPVMRTHAQQYAEPYLYPEQEEILLNLIKERYRWLPYNYTLAAENARLGHPLVRPLNYGRSSDSSYDHISDQYLWGNAVMVAPVMTEGTTSRKIVFPAGSNWIDLNTGRTYPGGGMVMSYEAPLEVLPVFVRAGSFIPMAEYAMESTADYKPDTYTVYFYPASDGTGKGELYIDDLKSPGNLSAGNYVLLAFQAEDGKIKVSTAEGNVNAGPETINIEFVIIVGTEKIIKSVQLNRADEYSATITL